MPVCGQISATSKNQKREDVKSHHYIISFDPRDAADNGLTVDQAQELGENSVSISPDTKPLYAPTRTDITTAAISMCISLSILCVLMKYPCCPTWTDQQIQVPAANIAAPMLLWNISRAEVMEMCYREELYQIDLFHGSKKRITEREYWAAKKGQLALDKENATREAAGQPTKPTKFETDKAKLRRTIRQALSQAGSFDEFSSLLLREGVTVKESRGRLSYLTPDRTKPITARKLGDDFDKAAVLALLTQNAHRAAEQTKAIPEYPAAVKKPSQGEKTTKTTPADNTLQRMVDREASEPRARAWAMTAGRQSTI